MIIKFLDIQIHVLLYAKEDPHFSTQVIYYFVASVVNVFFVVYDDNDEKDDEDDTKGDVRNS